jgi:STE24 endopeptidase
VTAHADLFSPDEVDRARRYHRPLYAALLTDVVVANGVLAVLAFASPGRWLYDATGGPWWARVLELSALVVAVLWLVRLPLVCWSGFTRERRWGFSTQTLRGWFWDRLKALAIGVVLTSAALLALVGSAHALPGAWPAAAAPGAALLAALLTFVAPVVLEPVFNRFRPLADRELAAELRSLAERAGVPVRDLLVADASRRTRKHNAYVSGLGKTRRVVIFDTLLDRGERRELHVVVAHELGHRRYRHVAFGALLGMLGAALLVLVLWALLSAGSVLTAIGATGPGDPRVIPFVVLVTGALELLALPLQAALSRRWERTADRFALELTRDAPAVEATFRNLARANLADLDPPPLVYKLIFTHPTPPERIAAAREHAA